MLFMMRLIIDTIVENKSWRMDFEKALADKKFEVWYQPKFNSQLQVK